MGDEAADKLRRELAEQAERDAARVEELNRRQREEREAKARERERETAAQVQRDRERELAAEAQRKKEEFERRARGER